MKLTKVRFWILGIIIAAIVGIGGVFLFKDTIKSTVNGIRADRLQAKAEAAFADESWDQASRQGRAAHYLDRENKEIQLLVARAQLKQRVATSVDWWKMVVNQPGIPVDELRELTQLVLNSGNIEDGMIFLTRLVELDGDNPETRRIWLQSLEQQRRYGRALELAGELARGGIEDWSVHQTYMNMQGNVLSGEGGNRVLEHLRFMIDQNNDLSLRAARELAAHPSASLDDRLKAVEYLESNAEDELDRLYALSLKVKEGMIDEAELEPILDRILQEAREGDLEEVLKWSVWMGTTSWFLENLTWEAYRNNGGAADPYLGVLYRDQAYQRLIELTEREYTDTDEEAASFLYYRAMALERTGFSEQAEATLDLAVRVADPSDAILIEGYLLREGRWNLLVRLYEAVLKDEPDNSTYRIRLLAAQYYVGNQEAVVAGLDRLSMEEFEKDPGAMSFILYLKVIVHGYQPEVHELLESLLVDYSEVFDYRLVLGISFLLQGQEDVARGFLEGMPDLSPSAPRYLRIASLILGNPDKDLTLPGELEFLMPRERYLLSRRLVQPTQ